MDSPIHLLVRFSDGLFAVGDVVGLHQQVIDREGAVWFGKLGAPVAQRYMDILNQQIQDGTPTYLYMVKGNRRKSTFYKAPMLHITANAPKKEKALIPPYYAEIKIVRHIKAWVKIANIKPLKPKELQTLKVASSVLEIEETLGRSSSGHFFVTNA